MRDATDVAQAFRPADLLELALDAARGGDAQENPAERVGDEVPRGLERGCADLPDNGCGERDDVRLT
jgi:hypothetical protein